ncbi:Myxococcus xanthus paralogous family TIGR02268 [Stigmatella aurantiaca]|uniref:Myxococcus xanthus paralogous family TIGR02268 n=1 Tax=Stigmatella aurantiaca TaxID=41 RepID=A0A1H8ECR5_STIAU|nr:DUF2381 family protein [Stigmatella aurantiaca]SEN17216.1 Myxococcus xanthus paralogous family TIGR02268 [Stigmatella aurantiaca]
MIQPLRLSLALVLLWGTAARAGPAPGERIERTRAVTVASGPAEPLPEVHVSGDMPTVLFFRAPIQKKTLTFDESRIRVLDAGELSVIVQAVTDLREGERHELGVFFADGRVPARAAFVLVTDPSEVDIRIDVHRPEPLAEPCPNAAQPRVPLPEDFVLLGYVDEVGVSVVPIKDAEVESRGLSLLLGHLYRATGWALVSLKIGNHLTQPRWTPREATFTGTRGPSFQARLVVEGEGMIKPGAAGRVIAVVDMTKLTADTVLMLELRGDDGRSLRVPNVRFPKAVMEGAQ